MHTKYLCYLVVVSSFFILSFFWVFCAYSSFSYFIMFTRFVCQFYIRITGRRMSETIFQTRNFFRFIYINLILKWILKAGCRKKNYMLLKIRKQYQDSTVKCNSHRSYFQCWITHPSIKIVRRRRNRILGFSFEKKEISFLFV